MSRILIRRGDKPLPPTASPAIGDRFEVEGHLWTLIEKRGVPKRMAFTFRADNGAVAVVHSIPTKGATR